MLVNLVYAAAEASGPTNPVSFDVWTLILQSANVLIIMAALYYLLFKPVGGMLKKREEFVENTLASAKTSKEEAEALLEKYQLQMREAGQEARQIVEKATADAESYGAKRRQEADAEAEALLERARVEIATERQRAIEAIRDEMSSIAVLAAGKVLEREIGHDDHEALVRDFVSKVGEPH